MTISTSFPFGLFLKERDVEIPGELVIWPRHDRALRAPAPGAGKSRALGIALTRAAGTRGDYRGLREYRPRDDPKDIHWRSSARFEVPVVREYDRDSSESLWICLDLAGQPSEESEALVEVTASLAARAQAEGKRFGLVAGGRTVPPAAGAGAAGARPGCARARGLQARRPAPRPAGRSLALYPGLARRARRGCLRRRIRGRSAGAREGSLMRITLLHRRLTILMGIAGLVAFAAGAGFEPISAAVAFVALVIALFWQPSHRLSVRLEPAWLPVAGLLVARALWHVFVVGDDVVIPVVDLLLLLLCAESLRSLDAPNDTRMYALSFALLLASTAYRPGIFFALAFVTYVTLATVALTLGHLRRKAQRHRIPEPTADRALLGATAGLGTVVLVTSVLVFLAFPRVTRGFTGRGDLPVTQVAGFSDQVSIGEFGSQIYANPQIVLRVEFPDGVPPNVNDLHWRGRSYDHFNGIQWSHSFPHPPANAPRAWYNDRWQGPVIEQRIFAAPLEAHVLFTLHPTLRLDSDRRIAPMLDQAGDLLYFGSAVPAYTAWSMSAPPPRDVLRAAPEGGLSRNVSRYYLQLPPLPDRILRLADSLTTGLTNRYDRAAAIERYLRTFTYTLQLPRTAQEATLDWFLFERRAGHCEYFSTAMVVLLRTVGIPARQVNGFRGGQWNDFGEYLAVTQNQAHSWVEVWFPGFGLGPPRSDAGGEREHDRRDRVVLAGPLPLRRASASLEQVGARLQPGESVRLPRLAPGVREPGVGGRPRRQDRRRAPLGTDHARAGAHRRSLRTAPQWTGPPRGDTRVPAAARAVPARRAGPNTRGGPTRAGRAPRGARPFGG